MCSRIGSGRLDGPDSHQSWLASFAIDAKSRVRVKVQCRRETDGPGVRRLRDRGTHPAALREDINDGSWHDGT